MLKIFLGDMPEAIYHPPTYFDNQYVKVKSIEEKICGRILRPQNEKTIEF